MRLQQRSSLVMFTCDQSRRADGSPGSGRVGAGRVSERDGEAIVPGRGGGGQAAALLLRSSHRPIQAGDQKQRREKEEQRRRQVAFSSGHGERGSRLTDIPNREQENQVQRCVCVCVSRSRRPHPSHGVLKRLLGTNPVEKKDELVLRLGVCDPRSSTLDGCVTPSAAGMMTG